MLDLVAFESPMRGAEPAGGPARGVARARQLSSRLFEVASQGDAEGRLTPDALSALQQSGLPLAFFPERHGGMGLLEPGAERELMAVLRLIGAGDLSVARITEGHVNAVGLVAQYGTERQLADLGEVVRSGGLSAVWNAEGRHPVSAELRSGRWHLSGEKILASGAGLVSHPIVTPRTDDGVVMLILDGIGDDRADLGSWTPQGMRASATGTIDLNGISASRAVEIGAPGDYLRQPTFSGGSWRFCAVHLGAAERLLDLFRGHLRARKRDGDPYQKQRVAGATAACITARLWIEQAATMLGARTAPAEDAVAFANLTRMVTERACLDVLEAVHRGVGLGAFMRPDPIERIARDLATYLRQPVPDAAMADAAAAVLASNVPTCDLWSL